MKLLKIGRLSDPVRKWEDALTVFDEVSVIKLFDPEEKCEKLRYFEGKGPNLVFRILSHIVNRYNTNPNMEWFMDFAFSLFRGMASKDLRLFLKTIQYEEVYAGYNDYDESSFLLTLLRPYLKGNITRAYKETRPGWSYLEKKAFEAANTIILNEKENKTFFCKKYGNDFFENKRVLTGLDEDAIGSKYIKKVKYAPKLSSVDGKKHLVILCGRAFSDSTDPRSGSRLYYVPMIKEFLKSGLVVHLHTLKIIPDANGVNQYEEIKRNNPNSFFIEPPLSFDEDKFVESYYTLSRYNFGVLHNFIEGTTNTEFDKYNIPHRYYEYVLAHVAPILLKGKTVVMERLIKENKTGIIYSKPEELEIRDDLQFPLYSFEDYIKKIYLSE